MPWGRGTLLWISWSHGLHENLFTFKLWGGSSSGQTKGKSDQVGPSQSSVTEAGFAMDHGSKVHMGSLGGTLWYLFKGSQYQDVFEPPWTTTIQGEAFSKWASSKLCHFTESPAY